MKAIGRGILGFRDLFLDHKIWYASYFERINQQKSFLNIILDFGNFATVKRIHNLCILFVNHRYLHQH